jgi:hypothetical protein
MKTHYRFSKLIALTGALMVSSLAVVAEENGIAHYNPGQTADFIDTLPGYPSFAYMNIFTYYDGKVGGGQPLPVRDGRVALNVKATSYSDSSVLLWETPLKVLGGDYSLFASIPYTWVTVSGDLQTGRGTGQTKDSASGIGDIYFVPAALGWTNGDFKWDGRFGLYAPSGAYSTTSLANPGLGFWTFEPEITFSWLSSKIGTEVSVFAGMDFNTENTAAHYTSGDVFHIDLTVAQHLPLFGGYVGVGANGYWMKQFTGDSGSGAVLGAFELQQLGLGPVVSYIRKIGKTELAVDLKWVPQIDVQNTMKGNYIWAKVALVF